MNMIWATGGGAINIIFERIGGVHFADLEGWNPDVAVAVLWTATGFGLTFGMLIAHRTSIYLDRKDVNHGFIGWALIIHGILFSIGGIYADTVAVCACRVRFAGDRRRRICGAGDDVPTQPAGLHSRPNIDTRSRCRTDGFWRDRAMWRAELMYYITPQTLVVISGISVGSGGQSCGLSEETESQIPPALSRSVLTYAVMITAFVPVNSEKSLV